MNIVNRIIICIIIIIDLYISYNLIMQTNIKDIAPSMTEFDILKFKQYIYHVYNVQSQSRHSNSNINYFKIT